MPEPLLTPSRAAGAPLFGLRWVPDSQLRPLRYLPNPQAQTPGGLYTPSRPAPGSRESVGTVTGARGGGGATGGAEADGAEPTTVKLQQHVRVLTQRLSEAQESVRQKVEQIRWLKEMTKDDASRARVARWMRGPLLRIFLAWKRCVRDTVRRALDELQSEHASHTTRHRELEVRCDDLSREHAVLQRALDHYFKAALIERERARVTECWRRWAPLRQSAGLSGSLASGRGGPTARRAATAAHALRMLHAHARVSKRASGLARRALHRHDVRSMRLAMSRLKALLTASQLAVTAEGYAGDAVRLRAALHRLWRATGRRRHIGSLVSVLAPHSARRALRLAWCRWTAEAVRRLGAQRKLEVTRAARAQEELSQQLALRQTAEAEAQLLRSATSLWGEDELPAMLANLAKAAENAEQSAADETAGGERMRKDAAVAAAGWQGTQLRLTVAVLDSLKKELARERAALASARAEAKASDTVAEQALTMLQALREEGAGLQSKLASLEEAKLRTEQALVKRDAELFDLGRAQHQAARALGLAIASVEERTFASLQRIDARCEARSTQLSSLRTRVATMLDVRSDRRLDEWTRSLKEPMAPRPREPSPARRT